MEFTWNHRVVHHDTDPENEYFAIHEAGYQDGTLTTVSPHFASVLGDTIEGLHESLNRFRDALSHPILRVSELYEKGQMFAEEDGVEHELG